MRRAVTGYRLTVALLLALLSTVVLANSWGVFQTDIKPEVYLAPGEMLRHYLSSWTSSPYLGSPNFNVGLVPVLLVTTALGALGLDPELSFKLFHLGLWVLAAWGASRLLRTLVPSASRWAGLVTGVAYVANPYTVTAGSTLAIALPLALLPVLLVAYVRALRAPRSWGWPAAFALVFAAMSGMNVAIVPVLQLLLLLPLAITVRHEQGLRWRQVLAVTARCGLLVVLLSLYWLVPAAAALTTGGQIVESSETLEGIAKVSSLTEVLRGLGLWAIYGRDASGPWVPQYAAYVAQPVFVLLTALWPAAALASLRWVPRRMERLVAVTTGLVAVVMVGLFPASGSSPFAWLLARSFDLVPALLAFRTTNKIGAGLALFFALALGLAAAQVVPRVLRTPGLAPVAVSATLVALFAWTAPAFTGNLYISPLDVPDYWHDAARQVDAGDDRGRVLVLPGQTRSAYRWSLERPDDLPNSLFTRDAVIPETTPNTSAPGANFLAALDDTLQSGTEPRHETSVYARYLGADQVLLRHDVRWEPWGGARPGQTADALSGDPGLSGVANFGRPGENTLAPGSTPASQAEALLPPLQLYGVQDARPVVRATALDGQYLVAGDGWAVASMAAAGLLDENPGFRYAQDVSVDELRSTLQQERSRLVLTDTNQRRDAIPNRLTAGQGAPLPADVPLGISRTLGDDPADQSVLVTSGVQVSATSQGGAFFDLPYGVPQNAVDGDPSTSWLFGDFRRAEGTSLTASLPQAREIGRVRITPTALGDVRISELEVSAGGTTRRVPVDGTRPVSVDLGGAEADEVRVEVTGITGDGFSLVGISEIDLGDDLVAERTVRTPQTFDRLYGELSSAERAEFAQMPLDVLLRRVTGSASASDDTERFLVRDLSVPDDREYRASAHVRVDGDVEPVYDELLDDTRGWTMTSSAYDFYNPLVRASRAADGDAGTAWVPSQDMQDAWWQVSGPSRAVDRVVIRQEADAEGEGETQYASQVEVSVDGESVGRYDVGRGRTRLDLPEGTRGRTVRVTITRVDGRLAGRPARFTTIDTGRDVRVEPGDGSASCVSVATLDGEPVRMRPSDPAAPLAGPGSDGTTWRACERVELSAGEHQLRPVEGWQLDDLTLRDVQGRTVARPTPPPVTQVHDDLDLGTTVEVGPAFGPYVLSTGQGFDPRWRASIDGEDLGDPVVVDGYAVGWVVEDNAAHTVHIDFAPQRWANVALGVSLLTLLVCLVLLYRAVVPRAVRPGREGSPFARWRRRDDEAPALAGVTREHHDVFEDPDARERVDPAPDDTPSTGAVVDAPPGATASHRRLPAALRTRVAAEVAVVLVGGFFLGVGGLLGGLAAVALARHPRARSGMLILGGVALVLAGVVLYVVLGRDVWPTVSADVVARSLVPHHVVAAGLVWAVTGALWRSVEKEDSDEPVEL